MAIGIYVGNSMGVAIGIVIGMVVCNVFTFSGWSGLYSWVWLRLALQFVAVGGITAEVGIAVGVAIGVMTE